MKAFVYRRYGGPEVLELIEVAKPVPAANELLVRVHASSINALEWHTMTGRPAPVRLGGSWRAPKEVRLGADFAGTVEAAGAEVTGFKPGDGVFGAKTGAYAEYVCVKHDGNVVGIPPGVGFDEAGATAVAGVTALQALTEQVDVEPGWRVLVNGASGGVGTFAVQIARSLGAEVTAVCSTANVEAARAMGAEHVIDYRKVDFTRVAGPQRVVVDVNGDRSFHDLKPVLTPDGVCVIIGSPADGFLLGPFAHVFRLQLGAVGSSRKVKTFIAALKPESLLTLAGLLGSGRLKPAIERRYPLERLPEAMAYFGEGHARGKIVITID